MSERTNPAETRQGEHPQSEEDKLDERLKKLWTLVGHLPRTGVPIIVAHFDGSCDSGTVDEVYAAGQDESPLANRTLDPRIGEATEEFVEAVLPGGWEINEGSEGRVIIDLVRRTVRIEHGWREVNYEYNELDFPAGTDPQPPDTTVNGEALSGREPALSQPPEEL